LASMVDPVHRKKTRLLAELYLATLRMRAGKFFSGLRVTDAGIEGAVPSPLAHGICTKHKSSRFAGG